MQAKHPLHDVSYIESSPYQYNFQNYKLNSVLRYCCSYAICNTLAVYKRREVAGWYVIHLFMHPLNFQVQRSYIL
jgi:hypothetical protein